MIHVGYVDSITRIEKIDCFEYLEICDAKIVVLTYHILIGHKHVKYRLQRTSFVR